jgi:hypothetical protein
MPGTKGSQKLKKNKPESSSTAGRVDLLFSGPLLFVPSVSGGNITGVEVFSPCNGHPIGAVFVPEVLYSDAELNDPKCDRWPEPESFSLLDPHSYSIDLTQKGKKSPRPFPVTAIPDTNHKVKPGRRLSGDWEVAVSIHGNLSAWSSHRLSKVTGDLYLGGDAPSTETTAAMQRLTYTDVTGADVCGASKEQREYLKEHAAKGGTLILLGEIPYQPTLLHERRAIDALAKLAGLDLHLAATDPRPHMTRLMHHVQNCGNSIIVG